VNGVDETDTNKLFPTDSPRSSRPMEQTHELLVGRFPRFNLTTTTPRFRIISVGGFAFSRLYLDLRHDVVMQTRRGGKAMPA
jgi:hypothetical protein